MPKRSSTRSVSRWSCLTKRCGLSRRANLFTNISRPSQRTQLGSFCPTPMCTISIRGRCGHFSTASGLAPAARRAARSRSICDLPQTGRRTLVVTAVEIHDAGVADTRILLTFNDITDFRDAERQLAAAREVAEQANLAKSRFLAAASHDLRQPLQTLTMLHDVLHSRLADEKAAELAQRAQETLDSMSGMLDALLDINQLEAGAIRPDLIDFPIDVLLDKLKTQFTYHASARGLDWRAMPCRRS